MAVTSVPIGPVVATAAVVATAGASHASLAMV